MTIKEDSKKTLEKLIQLVEFLEEDGDINESDSNDLNDLLYKAEKIIKKL